MFARLLDSEGLRESLTPMPRQNQASEFPRNLQLRAIDTVGLCLTIAFGSSDLAA